MANDSRAWQSVANAKIYVPDIREFGRILLS
jgi:hypothetical protein